MAVKKKTKAEIFLEEKSAREQKERDTQAPKTIPQVPSGVQEGTDVAFFKPKGDAPIEFAGPGAVEEGRALGQPTTPEQEEQVAREQVAQQFLEQKQFAEEGIPQRQELDIARDFPGANIPVLGPILQAGFNVGTSIRGDLTDEQLQTLIQDPVTAREIALQQMQLEVIKEGTSASEKFGATIEAIPIIGPLIGKWAGDAIEDPASNVDTLLAEIDSERERSATLAEKIMTGKSGDPFEAFAQIEDIESNIFKLEQRIRLLSLQSAVLIANADELNRIEEKILRAKERVFQAKQAAGGGLIAPASDTNVFLTLKQLQEKNK